MAIFRNDDATTPLAPDEQVSVSAAHEEVERLLEQFATDVPVLILDRAADIPGVVPPDGGVASGVLHGGRIYLLREGLDGRSAVVRTLWHELLHFGLRRFMTREEYTRTMGDLFARDAWVRMQARAWISGPEGQALAQRESAEYVQARGVDEALARLAEIMGASAGARSDKSPIERALRAVAHWVAALAERLGFDAAAQAWRGAQAQDQARELVRSVFARLRRGDPPAFAVGKAWAYSDPAWQSAWHGSPHRFERFSTEHIGSGEGSHNYVIFDDAAVEVTRTHYSIADATRAAYEARIDALFAGDKARLAGVRVLDRSDVLDMLGLGDGAVELAEGKVIAGQANHPAMTADVWKRVPAWLENPAAVFESDTVAGRLVAVAPEPVAGAPVLIIVEPNTERGSGAVAHLMVNAYDAQGGKTPFGRWVRDGLLRYVDQKTFPALLANTSRLQLPGTAFTNKPGTAKILTQKNLAGYRRGSPSIAADDPAGTTADALRTTLAAEFGADTIEALERAGLLDIAERAPASAPAGAAGATTGERISLFASNHRAGSAAVAYHEALHAALRRILGDADFDALMARLGNLAGWNRTFFEAAEQRIPQSTPAGQRTEELASYAVEEYQRAREAMPPSVRKWAQSFLAALKAGLARALQAAGVAPRLRVALLDDAAVLHRLARDGLRKMAREAAQGSLRGEPGVAYSVERRAPQTETAAFKRWFGDSKVVDAEGRPLVVYHGTVADFSEFRNGAKDSGQGLYFSPDARYASQYANRANPTGGNVLPVYLSLQNPKIIKDPGPQTLLQRLRDPKQRARATAERTSSMHLSKADVAALQAQGYDGIMNFAAKEFIAFHPEQIKSATGNNGDFSPTNPDIRYSISDALQARVQRLRGIDQATVRNTFADMIGSAGAKVSWWDKTLATQYAKAEKHPAYKRVFEQVQSYIEDVSTLANEAADLAPSILPRLESWKDLRRSFRRFGLSKADSDAVAAPLFEGTLSWARDDEGRPVRVDDVDRAGIVWTDDELRERFDLTAEQITAYREFRAAVGTSLDQVVAADVLKLLGDKNPALRDLALADRAAMREGIDEHLTKLAEDGDEAARKLRDDIREKFERVDDLKARGGADQAPVRRSRSSARHLTHGRGDPARRLCCRPAPDPIVQRRRQAIGERARAGHQPGAGVAVVARFLLQKEVGGPAGGVQLVRAASPGCQGLQQQWVAARVTQPAREDVQLLCHLVREVDRGADQPVGGVRVG